LGGGQKSANAETPFLIRNNLGKIKTAFQSLSDASKKRWAVLYEKVLVFVRG
jgi:hypothetical protein